MLLVKHPLGILYIIVVLRHIIPRHIKQCFNIASYNIRLCGACSHASVASYLFIYLLFNLIGSIKVLRTFKEFFYLPFALFAKLFTNNPHLFTKHILFLMLINPGMHFFHELLADFSYIYLPIDCLPYPVTPFYDVIAIVQRMLYTIFKRKFCNDTVYKLRYIVCSHDSTHNFFIKSGINGSISPCKLLKLPHIGSRQKLICALCIRCLNIGKHYFPIKIIR